MIIQKKFDNHIESLRGFVALMVVIHHLSNLALHIDPNYTLKKPEFLDLAAHNGVLIFFALSGYVIGISNKVSLKFNTIGTYFKKRLIRLYPIYFICVTVPVVILSRELPIGQVIANFLFLQVLVSPTIPTNTPLWSLHFEIVYYIVYVVVSFFSINPILLTALSLVAGLVNFILFPQLGYLTSVAYGFCFWLVGLALAKYRLKANISAPVKCNLLISNLFLLLSISNLNLLNGLLRSVVSKVYPHGLVFPENLPPSHGSIHFIDFAVLPYCLLFIINFGMIKLRGAKTLSIILQITPLLKLIYIPFSHSDISNEVYLLPMIWYIISTIFFLMPDKLNLRLSQIIIKKLEYLGSISFAMYAIHHPIMVAIERVHFMSGSLLTYLIRVAAALVLTFFVSYLLERKYQPWIRNLILSPYNHKS
jgi:peptidoglycan/LPS O-acetylase OafA/YrhL